MIGKAAVLGLALLGNIETGQHLHPRHQRRRNRGTRLGRIIPQFAVHAQANVQTRSFRQQMNIGRAVKIGLADDRIQQRHRINLVPGLPRLAVGRAAFARQRLRAFRRLVDADDDDFVGHRLLQYAQHALHQFHPFGKRGGTHFQALR